MNWILISVDDRSSSENEEAVISVKDVDTILHYVNQWVQRYFSFFCKNCNKMNYFNVKLN